MKLKNLFNTLSVAAVALVATACADTDAQYDIPDVAAPQLVSVTPDNGNQNVKRGDITMTVKYDKRVFVSSQKAMEQITVTGATLKSANVFGNDSVLTIALNCPTRETTITVNIPAGLVTNSQGKAAAAVSTTFQTVAIDQAPVAATGRAAALYTYLRNNFEQKVLTGMMADVAWNNNEAEQVYQWTGKYPAINGYDYIHLPAAEAGQNWINYRDITPVKSYTDQGGIATISWHWLVPKQEVAFSQNVTGNAIWNGSLNIGTGWGAEALGADIFANVKEGDYLIISFAENSDDTYWQIKLMDSSWNTLTSYADVDNGWGCIALNDGATTYAIQLNADDVALLQAGGILLSGYNITYTGLAISETAPAKLYSELDVNNDFTYKPDETTFDAANATVDGTWEKAIVDHDLAIIADYLKLLQDQNIPVLWRPLHEAAGQWFWWGKDAESFKALWLYTFNYLKNAGVNNLIWVWTSETGDDDWYPGDEYVDIIGRDIYGKDAETCANDYATLANTYGNKMIVLSECGVMTNADESTTAIADIAAQWAAGATWGWFMPWYNATYHTTQNWWGDLVGDGRFIWRDGVSF